MNVLVCCEESQAVCLAFRKLGHNAFSCDLQMCSGGFPEYHILSDCLNLINGFCEFTTCDGVTHNIPGQWDLIIAHPPCTYLAKSGSCYLFNNDHSIKDFQRYQKGFEAKDFFMKIYNADCQRIVIENPIPISIFKLPACSQIIQPYYFGDPYSKSTCLWLKGVSPLDYYLSDVDFGCIQSWCSIHSSAKIRSKTFIGIANAMAEQWGTNYVPIQLNIFGGYYNEY